MKRLLMLMLILLLALAACSPTTTAPSTEPADDTAQELPEEAQQYIEMARQALAAQLGIAPSEIALDSITGPAEGEGSYIIRLEVADSAYEFHGRDGEVLLVSDPLPPAPDEPVSSDDDGGDDGTEPASDEVRPVVIEEVGAEPGESDDFTLQGASVEGDTLALQVGYSGGCEPHQFSLHWAPLWLESLPVQTSLWLTHEANDDACEAFITETLRFDLTPLRDQWHQSYGPGAGTIVLLLADTEPLSYEFSE